MPSHLSPHDSYFRRVLGVPQNAASALRGMLSPELVSRLDLDGLTPVRGSFVDPRFRHLHTDALFSTRLDDREAFVYVLIEHQSSTDPLMAFRMLRYVVNIWDHHLRNHKGASRLPAILPIVVHHNRRPWSAPTEVLDLVDLDATDPLRTFLPRFRFLLDDLTRIDLPALRARPVIPVVRVMLVLMKITADNPRLARDLEILDPDIAAIISRPDAHDHLASIIEYIHQVGEATEDELRALFERLGPVARETYMTTAEMLQARGQAKALLQLLTLKFGPQTDTTVATVHSATPKQLETWTARILTATTVDEVLD